VGREGKAALAERSSRARADPRLRRLGPTPARDSQNPATRPDRGRV